jgi:glycosyltransferase involved in cell wall biosynthesis
VRRGYDRAVRLLQLLPHTVAEDGIQRASLDFTRALAEQGDSSRVLTLQRGDNFPAWRKAAETVLVVPSLSATWRQPTDLARALQKSRPIAAHADVVVVHRLDMLTTSAVLAWHVQAPLVLHAHNAPPPWFRWGDIVRAPGSRRVRRLIVASHYMEAVWSPVVDPAVPVHVVEYPIDPDFFTLTTSAHRRAAKAALGLAEDQPTVGFFGRLDPVKGLHILAEAITLLVGQGGREPHLIAQGAPGLSMGTAGEEYLERCRRAMGDGATWVPAGPDTRLTMAACDVIAVPSVWEEPSGLVVSEALCTGIPVVASAVGGIPEQLPRESPWARTVAPNDARALADALADVLRMLPGDEERRALRSHVTERRLPRVVGAAYRSVLLDSHAAG